MSTKVKRKGVILMAADCGCGGTCPICSYMASKMAEEHATVILAECERSESDDVQKTCDEST